MPLKMTALLTLLVFVFSLLPGITVVLAGGSNIEPASKTIEKIAAGEYHSVALDTEGYVWTWGNNDSGQLGISVDVVIEGGERHYKMSRIPQRTNLDNIEDIAAGKKHTLALDKDGYVWTWGNNEQGQLGDGGTINRIAPQRLNFSDDIVAIAAGAYHSLALDWRGRVWVWGANWYGQLGDGSTTSKLTPQRLAKLVNIKVIAAGDEHSVALTEDGDVLAWGRNNRGQLGSGYRGAHTYQTVPAYVKNIDDVTEIAVGANHTVALDEDRRVWAWGANWFGQLGIYDQRDVEDTIGDQSIPQRVRRIHSVTAIAAGDHHTVAIDRFDRMWAWGSNRDGQLGLGDGTPLNRRVLQRMPQRTKVLRNVEEVAAGGHHTVALDEDGQVWTWGSNEYGQLGGGSILTYESTPLKIVVDFIPDPIVPQVEIFGEDTITIPAAGEEPVEKTYTVIMRDERGTMLSMQEVDEIIAEDAAWILLGAPAGVSLGLGEAEFLETTMVLTVEPGAALGPFTLRLEAPLTLLNLKTGEETEIPVIAVKEITLLPPAAIKTTSAVAAGAYHTVALDRAGRVWTWGNNERGQLGDGGTENRPVPGQLNFTGNLALISIAAGNYHTVALDENGYVWTWGANEYGQLGDGSTSDRITPVRINLANITAVAIGAYHTVALDRAGRVWTWGNNEHGQLGNGSAGENVKNLIPRRINLASIEKITAGGWHTVVLDEKHRVWAWGGNWYGQLGNGSIVSKSIPRRVNLPCIKQVVAGNEHTVALDTRGQVWTWGDNEHGQLGGGTSGLGAYRPLPAPINLTSIEEITAGSAHTAVLDRNGRLWIWGNNWYGQLGNGNSGLGRHNSLPQQLFFAATSAIATGEWHTVALDKEGYLWSWGSNKHGQLGDGSIGEGIYKSVPQRTDLVNILVD